MSKDYAVVTWEAPVSDGGSPLIGYKLEKKDAKKTNFVKVSNTDAKTFEAKISKLVEGNDYIFQVYAENDLDMSEPAATAPVKAKLPFGMYANVALYFMQISFSP